LNATVLSSKTYVKHTCLNVLKLYRFTIQANVLLQQKRATFSYPKTLARRNHFFIKNASSKAYLKASFKHRCPMVRTGADFRQLKPRRYRENSW